MVFQDAINRLNNSKKIRIICTKLIRLMSLNNILRDNNIIKYYGGNEKVKLEYKKGNQNQIILINNYLNNKQFKHDIYIINNSQPKDLYKDLLSKSVNLKSKKIIPLTQYKE